MVAFKHAATIAVAVVAVSAAAVAAAAWSIQNIS